MLSCPVEAWQKEKMNGKDFWCLHDKANFDGAYVWFDPVSRALSCMYKCCFMVSLVGLVYIYIFLNPFAGQGFLVCMHCLKK